MCCYARGQDLLAVATSARWQPSAARRPERAVRQGWNIVEPVPGERCPRCGKPRWLGAGAYYRWNHLCGSIFIPPAPGELCECDRDDDKALRRRLEDALSANESLRNQLQPLSDEKAEEQLIANCGEGGPETAAVGGRLASRNREPALPRASCRKDS